MSAHEDIDIPTETTTGETSKVKTEFTMVEVQTYFRWVDNYGNTKITQNEYKYAERDKHLFSAKYYFKDEHNNLYTLAKDIFQYIKQTYEFIQIGELLEEALDISFLLRG